MEVALNRKATQYSRYGSATHKQVYVYGALGPGPIEISRNIGLAWGVSGWLVTPFLQKIGPAATEKLKQRVAAELKTTFASSYAGEISLWQALDPGHHRHLWQSRNRPEIPDQPEQGCRESRRRLR